MPQPQFKLCKVDDPCEADNANDTTDADDATDGSLDFPWREVNRLAVRRAVIGTLLRSEASKTVAELRDAVLASRPVRWRGALLAVGKVDDVLRYQERLGRVQRVGRGRWSAVPSAFSRTSTWRYTTWERQWDDDPMSWMNPPSTW